MFSTDFIFRQQENLVDNQKCQAGFRPLCNKILLVGSNLLWTGKIIFVSFKLDFSGLIFIIWTCPKGIGPVQNDWYQTKII